MERQYYIYPGSFSPCTKSHVSSICSIVQFCKRKGNPFTIIVSPANKYYDKPSVFEKEPQETQEPYMYLDENSRFEILIKSITNKKKSNDEDFKDVTIITEMNDKNDENYILVSPGEYKYGENQKIPLTSDVTAKEYNTIYGIPKKDADGIDKNVFLCLGSDNVEQDIFGWKDPNVIIDNINILKINSQSRQTYLQTTVIEEGDTAESGTEQLKTEYMNTQISKRYELPTAQDNIINILNNRPGNDPDSYYYKIKEDNENKISETGERNYDLDDFEIIDKIRSFDTIYLNSKDDSSSTLVRKNLKELKEHIQIDIDELVKYYKSSNPEKGGLKENNGGKTRKKARSFRKKTNSLKKNRKTKRKVIR